MESQNPMYLHCSAILKFYSNFRSVSQGRKGKMSLHQTPSILKNKIKKPKQNKETKKAVYIVKVLPESAKFTNTRKQPGAVH